MIDTLKSELNNIKPPDFWVQYALQPNKYFLLTLHRPANVDEASKLNDYLNQILGATNEKIIFPAHPRTLKTLSKLMLQNDRLYLVDPQGYHQFIYLLKHATAVVTDSGGIQEESTYLGVPCITLRDNTERYETVSLGSNELIGTDPKNILPAIQKLSKGNWKKGKIPLFWDGNTSNRIVQHILSISSK